MAGTGNGQFFGLCVWNVGGVPELDVLSTPTETHEPGWPAAGCGSGHRADTGRETGHLWVSAHSCPADSRRHLDQSQDGVAYSSTERMAFLHAEPFGEDPTTARGTGERAGAQPEMGHRHHGDQGLERREGAPGGYHRLRRPHGAILAVRPADAFGGIAGDGSGGGVPAVWNRERKSPKHRVLIGQRAGIRLSETSRSSSRLRDGGMPDSPEKPRIQRAGGGFLRKFQAGLCLSGRIGELGNGGPKTAGMDQRLQRGSSAQRSGNEIPRTVLCGLDVKNQHNACPKLGGSVQLMIFWGLFSPTPAASAERDYRTGVLSAKPAKSSPPA